MRPKPQGRVAAREFGFCRSIRLHGGKDGLVGLRLAGGEKTRGTFHGNRTHRAGGPYLWTERSSRTGKAERREIGFRNLRGRERTPRRAGLLREDAWKNDPAQAAENVMEPGPTTLRPGYGTDDATELLVKRKQDAMLVTSSDGKLMGAFRRRQSATKEQTPKSEI
jgi:hypothetical protein